MQTASLRVSRRVSMREHLRVIKGIVWSCTHCLIKFTLGLSSTYYRLLEPATVVGLWGVGNSLESNLCFHSFSVLIPSTFDVCWRV